MDVIEKEEYERVRKSQDQEEIRRQGEKPSRVQIEKEETGSTQD